MTFPSKVTQTSRYFYQTVKIPDTLVILYYFEVDNFFALLSNYKKTEGEEKAIKGNGFDT